MSIAIIAGIVGIAAIWVFFFLAKRAMRLMVRLTLALVLIVIMLTGALAWWWHGWSGKSSSPRPETTRPAPASRRAR